MEFPSTYLEVFKQYCNSTVRARAVNLTHGLSKTEFHGKTIDRVVVDILQTRVISKTFTKCTTGYPLGICAFFYEQK